MRYYHIINPIIRKRRRASGMTLAVAAGSAVNGVINVRCGMAYCAPVEGNFSRPRGKLIASGRLATDRRLPLFKQFEFETNSLEMLKLQVLHRLRKTGPPEWARIMIDREIDRISDGKSLTSICF